MNECILVMCMTLFSGFGDNYGAQVSSNNLYLKAEYVDSRRALTQGIELEKGPLSARFGFGSLIQRNTQDDSWGDMFLESSVRLTSKKGLYIRAHAIGEHKGLSIGLARVF